MNAAVRNALAAQEAELYRLGYSYGAWLVRRQVLGFGPTCSLTYFREKPSPEELQSLYDGRVLHIADAVPSAPPPQEAPASDLEVRADAPD